MTGRGLAALAGLGLAALGASGAAARDYEWPVVEVVDGATLVVDAGADFPPGLAMLTVCDEKAADRLDFQRYGGDFVSERLAAASKVVIENPRFVEADRGCQVVAEVIIDGEALWVSALADWPGPSHLLREGAAPADYEWPVVEVVDGATLVVDAGADFPPELAMLTVRVAGLGGGGTFQRNEGDWVSRTLAAASKVVIRNPRYGDADCECQVVADVLVDGDSLVLLALVRSATRSRLPLVPKPPEGARPAP